jgi:hypothetical protein
MKTYIDSSVILRRILGQPSPLTGARPVEGSFTSSLTRIECLRTLDRYRALGRLTNVGVVNGRTRVFELINALSIVEMDNSILERVTVPFPTPLATLDAIHMATALLWRESNREEIELATHDKQLALCARAMGIPVIGVA